MKQTKTLHRWAARQVVAALLLFVASVAANAYDFSAENDDGVTIYYYILSSSRKTCEVTYLYFDSTSNSEAYSGDVSIPEKVTYNGTTYTVTSIGSEAFRGCSGLTQVTIPKSVTSIGSYAFYQCTGLTQVTIGYGVTEIGSYAFYGCTGLTEFAVAEGNKYYRSVDGVLFTKDMTTLIQFPASSSMTTYTIPNSVTEIDWYAFYQCTGLTQVTIPNSVTEIGRYAFYGCTGLTQVTIPNSVTSIGFAAFSDCTGLTGTLTIPESVTSIGDCAFEYCSGLTSVTIGESVTSIGSYAFYGCTGLTGELIIPNSVTSIGINAFYWCAGLTQVTIGDGVTSIGEMAFEGCLGLTQFEVAEGNQYYCAVDGVLYSKDMTTLVQFPLSSPLLPSFDIPNSVTEICEMAFAYCSGLTQLTIPESVATIGFAAFYGAGLTSIYSLNPEPPTCSGTWVFNNVPTSTCVLYVPEGTKEAYSTADQWEDFKNIVEMDMTPVSGITADGGKEITNRYTTDGKQVSSPRRGMNIIRYSDGTTKKVLGR